MKAADDNPNNRTHATKGSCDQLRYAYQHLGVNCNEGQNIPYPPLLC